jgi:hypothetical protein
LVIISTSDVEAIMAAIISFSIESPLIYMG